MKLLLYHVKGLQKELLNELERKTEFDLINSSAKYIIIEVEKTRIEDFTRLRTVDDVQILTKYNEFERLPSSNDITQALDQINFHKTVQIIQKTRNPEFSFSLTTSKYQNQRIDTKALEEKIAEMIRSKKNWTHKEKSSEAGLNLRIHFEKKKLLISVRLNKRPSYYRDYREKGVKGGLRPSIAAALIERLENPCDLVDNFCGSGTILCEGTAEGFKVSGGDINREAVQKTRKNIRNLDPKASNRVKKLDATSTDWPKNYFDAAVSNMPWGEQINLNRTSLYTETIKEYRRILKPEAELILLGKDPEIAEKQLKKHFPNHTLHKKQIGFKGQKPWILYAKNT